MVKNDKHLLHGLDRLLELIDGNLNPVSKLLPGLVNIIDLVNVESARVGAIAVPHVHVHLDAGTLHEEVHCVLESIRVASSRTVVEPGDTL